MDLSEFENIQRLKKSTEASRRLERDLAKQEKASAEHQRLTQRLGLDKKAEGQTVRASEEAAVHSMRTKLAEMKAEHNKFAKEHGYSAELFPE